MQRRVVIHGHHQPERFTPPRHLLADRPDDAPVEVLDGLHLFPHQPLVAGLVRRLDVHEHEIVPTEHLEGGLRLALVVGVQVAGGPRDLDHGKTAEHAQPLEQVHCRDEAAREAEPLGQGLHGRPPALAPEPEKIGRALALASPFPVDRVVGENGLRPREQLTEGRHRQVLLEEAGHVLVRVVVGRHGGETRRQVVIIHQQVAVTDPRMQRQPVRAAGRLQGFDQLPALPGADVAAAVVHHGQPAVVATVHMHQVAAEGHGRADLHAHARRLQRRPAGVVALRFVAEQGEVGHVAAGRIPGRHGAYPQHLGLSGQPVHGRGRGCLERRPVAEGRNRHIAHAVADKQDIFHDCVRAPVV